MWHFHSALRLTHKSHWPAFERGKAARRPPCRLEKGTGNTPQHGGHCHCPGTAKQKDGEAEGPIQVSWAVKDQIPVHIQSNKKLFFDSFLVSSCLFICQSVCQAGSQALSMSEYCLYTWTYTHTRTHTHPLTHRQACALSVTLFGHHSLSTSLFWFAMLSVAVQHPCR